jgi:spore coat polysaccharide biosynthesis predicted glycosyltransferase SpsG
VKRCISIGEELKRLSHNVEFLTKKEEHFNNIVEGSGFSTFRAIDSTKDCDMFIVDSYSMDEIDLMRFKKRSKVLVRIDDAAPAVIKDKISDVLINGNPYATKKMYKDHVGKDCNLIVGSKYVPMDRNFRKARAIYKVRENIKELAITFGASDIGGKFAYRVLKSILATNSNRYTILLIPFLLDDKNKNKYTKFMESPMRNNLLVLPYISNIEQIFQKSDLAICSASSTCWQLAAVGVPFITFETASNQRLIFKFVQDKKIGIGLRKKDILNGKLGQEIEDLDRIKRESLSKTSRNLIDCKGSERIARALNEIH